MSGFDFDFRDVIDDDGQAMRLIGLLQAMRELDRALGEEDDGEPEDA